MGGIAPAEAAGNDAPQLPLALDDPPDCDSDDRDPSLDDRVGSDPVVDTLTADSTADWDGGTIVLVGASGRCSLAVTDNATATFQAATVNGSIGIATGTVDLAGNGSLEFVSETGAIALKNDGPDYGTRIAVTANGTVRERIHVPTGRFFSFAVRWYPNGTTSVAVWSPAEEWDRDWDLRIGDFSASERWRLRLDARAFLDEIAIGTHRASTPTETSDDPFPDSDFVSPVPESDPAGSAPTDAENGESGLVLAVLMIVFGAVGFRFAYTLSQFEERIDAIGSTTPWHEVEPADWKVMLNRIIFAALAAVGALWLLSIAV